MPVLTLRKPILDWLQLHPGLLSGARRTVAAPAPVPPLPYPDPEAGSTAAITAQAVLPWATSGGMTFHPPHPATPDAIGLTSCAYRSPEAGGTQKSALAEMTGYLTTRLQPAP